MAKKIFVRISLRKFFMKIIFKKIIFKNFPFAGKTFFDGYFFVLVVKSLLLIFGAAKTLRRNTWTAM